ncbi:MAG: V-type ATPase subunit [Anaerolineae bacterium]|nr:V-type ATPase subunit [Anaerolineae bacterium]MDH7474842.1 V-type ATPase subunit [Anaerolineae bacterium]
MPKGGVSGYSAVHARVRAMYSTMLTAEVWAALYEAPSFASLINILKDTVYGPYLLEVEEKALTPRRAIYQIKKHLANAYNTVIHLVPEHAQPLLTQLYRLFEVDNLKAVLRGIVTGASWDQVRYVLFPLGAITVLPAQAMVEAESVGAAVELLRGTPYYDTLAHAMERFTAEQSLFPLEVALDLDYRRELWKDINQLSGRDREQALHIVGSLIDMDNLMWAIRYRVYHHLSEEEIINYTVPFGYQVRDEDIRAIAAGADIAQVLARVYPDLTDVRSLLEEPRRGLPLLEVRLQKYIVERCREAFIGYPFHVGIPLAYVVLNELEIQDLTVLVEAKSLRIPVEEFRSHLLMGCVY